MAAIKCELPTDDGIVKAKLIVKKDETGKAGLLVNAKSNFVEDDTLINLAKKIYSETGHKFHWVKLLGMIDKEAKKIETLNFVKVRFNDEKKNKHRPSLDFGLGKTVFGKRSDFKKFSKKRVFTDFNDVQYSKKGEEGIIFAQYYDGSASTMISKKGNLLRKIDKMMFKDENGKPFFLDKFGADSWGVYANDLDVSDVPKEGYIFDDHAFTEINGLSRWDWVAMVGVYVPAEDGPNVKYKKPAHFEARSMIKLINKTSFDNTSENGRYELGAHTKLSQLESVANSDDLLNEAAKLGLQGVAFTDSTSVQSYEVAMHFQNKFNHFRPLFGTQLNEIPDKPTFVWNPNDIDLHDDKTTFIAFDMETTGLSAIHDQIIQLSAVRMKREYKTREVGRGKRKRTERYMDVQVIDTFDTFVNPGEGEFISQKISDITGIHDEDVRDAPNRVEAIQSFMDFINEFDDTVLVGHNVVFDMRFLNQKLKEDGKEPLKHEIFDTLPIARRIIKHSRGYNLTALSKKLGVKLDKAHDSLFDAEATGRVFFRLIEVAEEGDGKDIEPAWHGTMTGSIIKSYEEDEHAYAEGFPTHVSLIAKDQAGIKDIYELISTAHIKHFFREPRIYIHEVHARREKGHHFFLGSGDSNSTLYDLVTRYGHDIALEYAKKAKFDYLEISLPSTVGMDFNENPVLMDVYRQYFNDMMKIADETDALPVVTGDVHYVTKDDKIVQEILVQRTFDEDQSLKSAEQIKEELKHFADEETLQKIVVDNTIKIGSQVDLEHMEPIHEKLTPPRLEGSDEELRETSWKRAHELYGENLDQLIIDRINKELDSVIKNGYAVVYLTAKRIVDWSVHERNYIVGSRGSVGGSFVAYLVGITEVNPLPPHYRSKHGDYVEFVDPKKHRDGWDLPDKEDPNHHGELLIGDGHNASFEVFAGVSGKKVPDIDLNVASDVQLEAQLQMKKIFGDKHVLRVGNISTISDKLSWRKVRTFQESTGIKLDQAEATYYHERLIGVKSTTGQHAAGIIVIPQDKDITDFTPYNWPANKQDANWMTTHLNKDMIHDSLLKMDLLGHTDEVIFHYFDELTGVGPLDIDPRDFSDAIRKIYKNHETVRGMPEIGAGFSSKMIDETKPETFADLVQIMGLSHGTDVWTGNAQELVNSGTAKLSEVIDSRDKILNDTMSRGYTLEQAHELVQIIKRHDKMIPDEKLNELREMGMPEWYLDSMKKVTYLFPMAHSIAYALSAVRMAWYKANYPDEFYAGWLNYHGHVFDVDVLTTNDVFKFHDRLKQAEEEGDNQMVSVMNMAINALGHDDEYISAGLEFNEEKKKDHPNVDRKRELFRKKKKTFEYDKDFQKLAGKLQFRTVNKDKSLVGLWYFDKETHELYAPLTSIKNIGGAVAEPYVEFREENGRPPKDPDELKSWAKDKGMKAVRIPKKTVDVMDDRNLWAS